METGDERMKPIWMNGYWDVAQDEAVKGRMLYTPHDILQAKIRMAFQMWWMSVPRRKDGKPDMRYRVSKAKTATSYTTYLKEKGLVTYD
jgi:hypothetical protein|tara:strand:+ start:20 stop:286 length:267 start_codon:yes stop_codon:yes gene_type:complete